MPASLAIRIARQAGMPLASFCRRDGFVDDTAGDAPPLSKETRDKLTVWQADATFFSIKQVHA
ncbi:hypothetical protein [Janthinobacterium sp. MDT1-19]|uniref:hypothetical protein n=1 Tax=Janthinobacterium sp. MDT1-19 TaxID=1259339 RepID=UPI003F24E627